MRQPNTQSAKGRE